MYAGGLFVNRPKTVEVHLFQVTPGVAKANRLFGKLPVTNAKPTAMRKRLCSGLLMFISLACFSQDFSNKGKDFWLAYGYHVKMPGANSQRCYEGERVPAPG